MNCSDAQGQMTYSDVQGQNTLSEVLSTNYKPQASAGSVSSQMGPYATAGSTSKQANPYANAGITTQQTGQLSPITPTTQPMPMTVASLEYLNGALRTQIGNKVTVDFLIGTNTSTDRTGTLLAVGANYIILNEIETDDILFCDYYTIKFVKVYK